MGGRKQKMRELKPSVYIIGEGITEQYYFSHIKKQMEFNCTVKPRFFGNTSIDEMEKRIDELLCDDVFVICVFDADVSARNKNESEKLEKLRNKYRNDNLLLCNSLPSIEYWFLLHFENTTRHFDNAKAAEVALRKHMSDYEKTTKFLENEKWVRHLCTNNRLPQAIERSKQTTSNHGSYTNMHKAFEVLESSK